MSIEKRTIKDSKVFSIEQLKQFDGFEDVTDKEALEIIKTLKQLAFIIVSTFKNQ